MLKSQGSSASKQIVVKIGVNGANTVAYTVPSGKTFVGNYHPYPGSNNTLKINGVENYITQTSSYWHITIPLTLVSGTTVGSGSSYYEGWIIGVES